MQTHLFTLMMAHLDNYPLLLSLQSQDGIQSLLEGDFRLETPFGQFLVAWIICLSCYRRLLYRVVGMDICFTAKLKLGSEITTISIWTRQNFRIFMKF